MMIRLSGILQPVYEEILAEVKHGVRIWADETGWRVKGELWWLRIFANRRSALYWAEHCRNAVLAELIEKVRRQRQHILTVVEHEDATARNNYGEYIINPHRHAPAPGPLPGGPAAQAA